MTHFKAQIFDRSNNMRSSRVEGDSLRRQLPCRELFSVDCAVCHDCEMEISIQAFVSMFDAIRCGRCLSLLSDGAYSLTI